MTQRRSFVLIGGVAAGVLAVGAAAGWLLQSQRSYQPQQAGIFGEDASAIAAAQPAPLTPEPSDSSAVTPTPRPGPPAPKTKCKPRPLYAFA